MSVLTPAFLDSALDRVGPAEVQGDKSHVLVLFRLSERGAVIDARATSGSERVRKSAVDAVHLWRFRPTLVSGRPVEITTAVLFDFSASPVRLQVPAPMGADEISPVLGAGCELALVKKDANSVGLCRKEAVAVDSNRAQCHGVSFCA